MEHTGIKPKVIEEIRTFARKYNIDKVILFGSRARGDYRRTSDIDLAVVGGDFAGKCRMSCDSLLCGKGRFYMKKYENFCSALCNMKEIYKYDPPYDTVILTGLVGLFEVCFEQSWKMMKEILESHGYEEGATGSPKIILKTAYKAGMIKDEELWLRALQERNNVAHSYNERIALGIVMRAKESFYDMFCELKKEIDKNWI